MRDTTAVLEELLADNPGPISIAAGVAALRAIGNAEEPSELQSQIGTFAAERGRAIRFDLLNEPKTAVELCPHA